jgi:hypothetical protein
MSLEVVLLVVVAALGWCRGVAAWWARNRA